MKFENSPAFAKKMDEEDVLKSFRNEFYFPDFTENVLYFTGNSLGLQPKQTKEYIQQELDDWAKWGVEGHFKAKNPWYSYHEWFAEPLSKIVGALPSEVVVMNTLTTNLHLLMVSFYRPSGKRYKILCEAKAFPSDRYALQSQVKFHGYNPEDAIIEVYPREGEYTVRLEDVLQAIEDNADSLALVMMGGVNYYTGQVFDMKSITQAAHKVGAYAGFDLAHAAGNIPMQLHDWEVDFAAWCSYKYLNSGPGGVSGIFVHEKHCKNTDLIRFAGWWGHDKSVRFKMEPQFKPMPTAEAWQLSNAPVISMACHKASLKIFNRTNMQQLREKSKKLTGYLDFILKDISSRSNKVNFEVITPEQENERGCQLSILTHGQGKTLFETISKKGVVADWREPNVIRVAPVPLYNSFEDIYRFGQIIEHSLE